MVFFSRNNIFLKKYWLKLEINQILTIYLEYKIMIMCGFHCVASIEYMLGRKLWLDYTNLSSLDGYYKIDKIIYNYFQDKYVQSQI